MFLKSEYYVRSHQMLDYLIDLYSRTIKLNNSCKLGSIVRLGLVSIVSMLSGLLLNPRKLENRCPSRSPRVIVSLTSFPARINDVWKTIVSLMNQTRQPDKIVLWLSRDQHPSIESLPTNLKKLISYGLDIRLVDNDYKSHKKYFYAYREFPDDYVLLVDDDIIYPSDTISTLLDDMSPEKVHCSYGSIVKYDSQGEPLSYTDWESVNGTYLGREFFFGSGGGTILMPSKLPKDVLDIETALKLCPTADDIWLNGMCRLAGLKIEKVRTGLIFPVSCQNKETLCSVNMGQNQNDIQLSKFRDKYSAKYLFNT